MEFAEQLRVSLLCVHCCHSINRLMCTFFQKKFCIERNENMLDADYEMAFKKISEEFDSIGHQW